VTKTEERGTNKTV